MAVTLPSGIEVNLDLNKITLAEYRSLFDDHSPDEDDAIIAHASGMTVEELQVLGYTDYRALITHFWEKAKDPLADPN